MHTVPLEQEFTLDEPGVGKDEADADCGSRLRGLEDDNALYDLEAEADGAALGERLAATGAALESSRGALARADALASELEDTRAERVRAR